MFDKITAFAVGLMLVALAYALGPGI